jgi:hypothetical protein
MSGWARGRRGKVGVASQSKPILEVLKSWLEAGGYGALLHDPLSPMKISILSRNIS